MTRRRAALLGVTVFAGAVLLAACGSSTSLDLQNVSSVTVTRQTPGIAPPGNAPDTIRFDTPNRVAEVVRLLKAHQIAKGTTTGADECTGGTEVDIDIVAHGAHTHLSSYACANQTSGNIAGDLRGFLNNLPG